MDESSRRLEGSASQRSLEKKLSLKEREHQPHSSQRKEGGHHETAVKSSISKRQAITELLFFSCVGSLSDCKRIVKSFEIIISDPATADYDKRTPLHLASAEGHLNVVTWLLSKGSFLNPVDRFKRTPLEEAVRSQHGKIVSILIQHKGKVVGTDGNLVDLALSHLSGNVNVDIGSEFTPDWCIDSRQITLLRKISEGSHGSTYKARWRGTVCAVKVLKNCEKLNTVDLISELNVMYKVHHPNAVQLLGAVINQSPIMIVYEFMTGGSILDTLKSGSNFSLWRSLILAIDLAKGIDHLHNRQVPLIHGDLRPSNLLLGGSRIFNHYHKGLTSDEIGVLKIADYGLTKTLQKNSLLMIDRSNRSGRDVGPPPLGEIYGSVEPGLSASSTHFLNMSRNDTLSRSMSYRKAEEDASVGEDGPFRYQAPELFRKEAFTTAVDVYSFGMICYHLFECCAPFASLDPEEAARVASEGKRPTWGKINQMGQAVPLKLKQIVEECWSKDPEFRPKFETVVKELQEVARKMKPSVTERPSDQDDDGCGCCG